MPKLGLDLHTFLKMITIFPEEVTLIKVVSLWVKKILRQISTQYDLYNSRYGRFSTHYSVLATFYAHDILCEFL